MKALFCLMKINILGKDTPIGILFIVLFLFLIATSFLWTPIAFEEMKFPKTITQWIILLGFGAFNLILAIGLIMQKYWIAVLTIAYSILLVPLSFLGGGILLLIFSLFSILYLSINRKNFKQITKEELTQK